MGRTDPRRRRLPRGPQPVAVPGLRPGRLRALLRRARTCGCRRTAAGSSSGRGSTPTRRTGQQAGPVDPTPGDRSRSDAPAGSIGTLAPLSESLAERLRSAAGRPGPRSDEIAAICWPTDPARTTHQSRVLFAPDGTETCDRRDRRRDERLARRSRPGPCQSGSSTSGSRTSTFSNGSTSIAGARTTELTRAPWR